MADTAKNLNNSPSYESRNHAKLSRSWSITTALWGSSLDIREQGEKFLTRFKSESHGKYAERKNSSVFENEFRLTCETMAGMVFRKDPKPEDAEPQIEQLFTDIDQCGNSFWNWAISVFEKYLRDGNGFIFVDAPPLKPEIEEKLKSGYKPTKADRLGDRPFWVFYEAAQCRNYQYVMEGSRPVLSKITFEEKTIEPDGEFGEKEVVRYRVLTRGAWHLWGEDPGKKGEFTIIEGSGKTGLNEIPIVPIDAMEADPPLLTLALLNILHYNQTSDYDNICHLVCAPAFVRKYDSKEDADAASKIHKASPASGINIWGQHANVFYVEVAGTGMERAERRFQDVKAQMTRIGVGMLAPTDNTGVRTATEIVDTASQRQSKLARFARNFENAVEKALYFTAEMVNAIFGANSINLQDAEQKAKLKLQIDYDRLTFTMEQVQFFSSLVDSEKLSLETFLRWLNQVMDMPPGFDPKKELLQIAKQPTNA